VIRWGLAGPGIIASEFAEAMRLEPRGDIVAVASRSMERAQAYGDRFDVPRRYEGYGALASDDGVDVVYVATPPSRHEVDVVRYLDAGKHVLCEKPMALNAGQVRRMAAAAQRNGVFLMEAVWSRFLPAYARLGELLAAGRIGEPVHVDASFGFRLAFDPANRLYDPLRGGGALLDLGIYPIQLCLLVLGPVDEVVGTAVIGRTGVDESTAAVLRHRDGGLGVIEASLRADLQCSARISGTEGHIDVPAFMHCPMYLDIASGGTLEHLDLPWEQGLHFEIGEVHRCLDAGLAESPGMTLDESVALATVMDSIRAQAGVTYPDE
jgi:predicted dehydrogenase